MWQSIRFRVILAAKMHSKGGYERVSFRPNPRASISSTAVFLTIRLSDRHLSHLLVMPSQTSAHPMSCRAVAVRTNFSHMEQPHCCGRGPTKKPYADMRDWQALYSSCTIYSTNFQLLTLARDRDVCSRFEVDRDIFVPPVSHQDLVR